LNITLAGSRSAGFTCCFFSYPLSFADLVNASLRKPPSLSADGSLEAALSIFI